MLLSASNLLSSLAWSPVSTLNCSQPQGGARVVEYASREAALINKEAAMPQKEKTAAVGTACTANKKDMADLDIVYQRCCGVDVHKDIVVVCCVSIGGKKQVRSFGTMTSDLLDLCAWLKAEQVEMVAMESTASYWKPIFNLLEVEEIPAILVNAQHVKNLPGRKTDVKDSEWLAMLLRVGLLKPSFVAKRDQRELRELVRYRKSIVEERSREYCRMDKVLQGANIKLSSVMSGLETLSGMEMIRAIARGENSEAVIASLAKGSLRNKQEELLRALRGYIQPHQRMILSSMLAHIESLDTQIETLDTEIQSRLAQCEDVVERVTHIPGVGNHSAQVMVSEIGTDMSQFPDTKHLTSWAGLCPGNNESAGKKKRGRARKGNKTLRTTLVQCARSAARTKNTYLSSMYSRIASRRGANVAAVAVARTILETYFYMLRDNVDYNELGASYYDERNKEHIRKRAVKRLEGPGFKVTLEEAI